MTISANFFFDRAYIKSTTKSVDIKSVDTKSVDKYQEC